MTNRCCFTPGQLLSQPEHTTPVVDKPKIARTRFSIYQKVALENSFLSSLYLTGEERDVLASKLGLSPVIVQVNIMLSLSSKCPFIKKKSFSVVELLSLSYVFSKDSSGCLDRTWTVRVTSVRYKDM